MGLSLLRRYQEELILFFLALESAIIWTVASQRGLFWLFLIVALLTAGFFFLTTYRLSVKNVLKSGKLRDLIFLLALVFVFNVNILIIPNLLILLPTLVIYFFGLKYLLSLLKKEAFSQAQKNALILAVLIVFFLGSNFLATAFFNIENGANGFALFAVTLTFFGFAYLVSKYNFDKNKIDEQIARTYSFVLALILSQIFLIFSFFSDKYPNIREETSPVIAISVVSLFIILVYYCVWGIMIHKLENKLNFRIIFEYVGITVVIVGTLLLTINWF